MWRGLLTGSIQLERDPVTVRTAAAGHAIKVANLVPHHTCLRLRPVHRISSKAVQHRFLTRRRIQLEHRSAPAGNIATEGGSAIKITHVISDQTCERTSPVGTARESVEYVFRATGIQLEHHSDSRSAAESSGAVKTARCVL